MKRLAFAVLAFTVAAAAQTGQGTIVGQVTDSSGAIIPGVKIRIADKDTGFSYSPETNQEGLYRQPYLNPGNYEVTFEAQGFKKLVRTSITVRSTETVRLDALLEVGQVVESVEVGANATLLETETSSTGHLVSGVQLNKLPTPQMKIESMLWYVPGVTGQGGNGHAAGGRSRSFSMTTDGVSALTPGTGVIATGRNMSTAEHNMEEVKVITTVLPAEYGHSGGGVMSIVFKSGTNQLHGLAEERYMARHFIHRNWQDAAQPTNNFGFHLMSANITGPVVIPKIYNGRNKTFFLWGFQRHHEKASENANATVPTPAMLAGDFSFGGIGDPIYDPASLTFDPSLPAGQQYARTQFPGNRIPLSRVDPVFTKFMSFNPYNPEGNRNNQAFMTRRGPQDNLSADTVYRSYRTGIDWKIDHSFSDRHKIFGRESYFRHRSFNGRWQINVAQPLFDVNVPPIPIEQNQLVISDTFVVSPTVINEVRFGGNRRNFTRNPEANGQDWASKFGIPGVGAETVPAFQGIYFTFPGGSSKEVAENMSLQENLTIVRGRHTFKTGYEILRTRHNVLVATQPSGSYNFGGTEFPFRPNTGNPFASFMLGAVGNATFNRDLATWLPRWWSHAAYFQDDWKVNRKMTLNLGMRWQYESPFSTKWGQQSQFSPTATDALTGRPGAIVHPRGLLAKRDLNNFQPRIGMAYTITPRLVFRGGFALNTLDLWTNGLNENFDEYLATTTVQPAPGNPDVAFYLRNGPGRVTFPVNSEGVSPFVGTNFAGRSVSYFDPSMRMPYVMNWNGGFQYELSSRVLVDVNYQGSSGVGLLNRWDTNVVRLDASNDPAQLERIRTSYQNFRPFTNFGSIFHYSNYGHSSFHSGTVKVEKRYSKGLSLTTFYTFAKSIDQASDDGAAGGITYYNRSLEKGRSNFDVTHRWVTYALWEIPVGKGRKWLRDANWFVNGVLGGWELNVIQTAESGIPLTFGIANSTNVFLPGAQRANMAAGKTYDDIRIPWDRKGPDRHRTASALPWADISAFAHPASFTAGASGRNIITGPGNFWHQASISKTITIRERLKGTLRYDINNPFKYYFFNNPNTTVDFRNPQNFGKINGNQGSFSGLGGRLYQQIIFKLEF